VKGKTPPEFASQWWVTDNVAALAPPGDNMTAVVAPAAAANDILFIKLTFLW
jgi:hypothetical protein